MNLQKRINNFSSKIMIAYNYWITTTRVWRQAQVKIIWICSPYKAYGGGQQYLYRIGERLAEDGIKNFYLTPEFKDSREFIHRVGKYDGTVILSPFRTLLFHYLFLAAIVKLLNGRAIHVNGIDDNTKYAILIKIISKKIKVCVTSHLELLSDLANEIISQKVLGERKQVRSIESLRWPLRNYFVDKYLLQKADLIIFVNKFYKNKYHQIYELNSKKLKSIYNGIDTEKFSADRIEEEGKGDLRKKFGINDDALIILAVGNLVPQKRHDIGIRAFSELRKKGINCRMLIVGDGYLRPSLKKLAQELRVDREVYFLGFQAEMLPVYSVTDIFIMPSEDEGLPYALLEARACCIPCIATKVGGVPEIINDGIDGYLINMEDVDQMTHALLLLASDIEKRIAFGRVARIDTVERFNIKIMQEKTRECLLQLYN